MTPAPPPTDISFTPADLDRLQALLDALPAPLEPLDLSAIDGFLCGVLLQPVVIPASRWLPLVIDSEGRALPPRLDLQAVQALLTRRHGELERAIAQRQWFDPWVFELEETAPPSEAVAPWVAGFALAVESFPALLHGDAPALNEPLALLYRHLDPDDLEDADDLLEAIEELEPPTDLAEAVEDLVRATLLLADVSRPRQQAAAARRGPRRPPRR